MHGFFKYFAVALTATALSGCGPSLKPGENYYPYSLFKLGRNPNISINHLGPQWTILVNGEDKSGELGFSVDDSQLAAQGYIDVTILRPTSIPLSPKFRLSMFGGVQCTDCPEIAESWRHSTISAN
jgi:hypothetical protein